MNCPGCGTENLVTSTRCIQCGTSLVGEVVGGSETYRKHARVLNAGMYAAVGAFIAFSLSVLFAKVIFSDTYWSDSQIYGGAVMVAGIGGAIGRFIAHRQYREF